MPALSLPPISGNVPIERIWLAARVPEVGGPVWAEEESAPRREARAVFMTILIPLNLLTACFFRNCVGKVKLMCFQRGMRSQPGRKSSHSRLLRLRCFGMILAYIGAPRWRQWCSTILRDSSSSLTAHRLSDTSRRHTRCTVIDRWQKYMCPEHMAFAPQNQRRKPNRQDKASNRWKP